MENLMETLERMNVSQLRRLRKILFQADSISTDTIWNQFTEALELLLDREMLSRMGQ